VPSDIPSCFKTPFLACSHVCNNLDVTVVAYRILRIYTIKLVLIIYFTGLNAHNVNKNTEIMFEHNLSLIMVNVGLRFHGGFSQQPSIILTVVFCVYYNLFIIRGAFKKFCNSTI